MAGATFILRAGLPRSSKTYSMVVDLYKDLVRNKKWYEQGKTKEKRKVVSQLILSPELEKEFEGYLYYIIDKWDLHYQNYIDSPYRLTMQQVVTELTDADIYFDEIDVTFDADNYQNIPRSYKTFLTQYGKRGNTIQATTTDASQLYSRARRKVTKIFYHTWIMGSPTPSPTRPKISRIWGIYHYAESKYVMSPDGKAEVKPLLSGVFKLMTIFQLGWISKKYTDMYNTRQSIVKPQYEIQEHKEYICEHYGNPEYNKEHHKYCHQIRVKHS